MHVLDWGDWSYWSKCDAMCGGGKTSRHRQCFHGPCKGHDYEEQECNKFPCPCKYDIKNIQRCVNDFVPGQSHFLFTSKMVSLDTLNLCF